MSKKRKLLYWLVKLASVLVSCAFPLWAIYTKFPLWGTKNAIGVGGILAVIVIFFIFRRTIFSFLREKLNLLHAPPIVGWIVLLGMSYGFLALSNFVADIIVVFWMGFIGCCIGTALTFIAENCIRKDKDDG